MVETTDLAAWLRREMEIRGLTYREVAEKLGVHLSTVHHWGTGLSRPTPRTLAQLVEVLSSLPANPRIVRPRSKAELRRESLFAAWLAERKHERGLSVSEMATALGVGKSTVSGWLAGRNQPLPETCDRLATYLGVPPEEIMETLEEV